MAETINMPKLGFDMAEGTLVRWVKKVGETVNKGEVLAEIETDKATVEVESPAAGVVRKLLVDEGAVVPVVHPLQWLARQMKKLKSRSYRLPESTPQKKETVAQAVTASPSLQPASVSQANLGVMPFPRWLVAWQRRSRWIYPQSKAPDREGALCGGISKPCFHDQPLPDAGRIVSHFHLLAFRR